MLAALVYFGNILFYTVSPVTKTSASPDSLQKKFADTEACRSSHNECKPAPPDGIILDDNCIDCHMPLLPSNKILLEISGDSHLNLILCEHTGSQFIGKAQMNFFKRKRNDDFYRIISAAILYCVNTILIIITNSQYENSISWSSTYRYRIEAFTYIKEWEKSITGLWYVPGIGQRYRCIKPGVRV